MPIIPDALEHARATTWAIGLTSRRPAGWSQPGSTSKKMSGHRSRTSSTTGTPSALPYRVAAIAS